MFCAQCGSKLSQGTKFCPNCGYKIEVIEKPSVATCALPNP
ncbi:MAG TPA: zinc-ribbon domain-containing protein [Candidatus Mediterraneibacter tabaqchaliae]|uniref:Zinc-ribbon domain-containing protein n=1 Tax=Candidatus Mediterraneibacter tabaqchaliae TaxID=2838689 RepID=A0A9D2U0N7_9FIRM|nr:zinc-ribbon domain-containing protein [Candidatus Mediterraneibacter tabaqchaliae]